MADSCPIGVQATSTGTMRFIKTRKSAAWSNAETASSSVFGRVPLVDEGGVLPSACFSWAFFVLEHFFVCPNKSQLCTPCEIQSHLDRDGAFQTGD